LKATLYKLFARIEAAIFILHIVAALTFLYAICWLLRIKEENADQKQLDMEHDR
jgi:hypothetical protein